MIRAGADPSADGLSMSANVHARSAAVPAAGKGRSQESEAGSADVICMSRVLSTRSSLVTGHSSLFLWKSVATTSVFPRRGSLSFPDDQPTTNQIAASSCLPAGRSRRSYSCGSPLLLDEFDSTVLRPPLFDVIVSDGLILSPADRRQACCLDPLRRERCHHGLRAVLRKGLIRGG